ncbi:MAG: hypothetical protein R3E08_05170 [Thiotrichaceae bacterium]
MSKYCLFSDLYQECHNPHRPQLRQQVTNLMVIQRIVRKMALQTMAVLRSRVDQSKTCAVTFTKRSFYQRFKSGATRTDGTALENDPNRFAITLDASQSTGNITGYKIQIYNSDQADKPIISKELALILPRTTENLPVNQSYAIHLIVKDQMLIHHNRILLKYPILLQRGSICRRT